MEFYEDYYDEDEQHKLDMWRGESGEVEFIGTGDPLIDKWEQELAQGLQPDLTEGLSYNDRKQLDKEKTKTGRLKALEQELEGSVLGSDDITRKGNRMRRR